MISVQGFILQSHQHRDAIPKANRDQVRTGDSPKTRKRHGAILILEWRRAVENRMDWTRGLKPSTTVRQASTLRSEVACGRLTSCPSCTETRFHFLRDSSSSRLEPRLDVVFLSPACP